MARGAGASGWGGGGSGAGGAKGRREEYYSSGFVDSSAKYAKTHQATVDFVKNQIGINLNKVRDGDGSSPSTTSYWDKDGPKVAIDFKALTDSERTKLMQLSTKPYGVNVEQGGAWIWYVSKKKGQKR